jgi:transposase
MSRKRLPVRKIREVLRLKYAKRLSHREIARSCQISYGAVCNYVERARKANLSWPLPEELDDAALEARLFRPERASYRCFEPDWEEVHKERQRKGVTLYLLWQEYKARQPDGLAYSTFAMYYGRWKAQVEVVMRQEHKAGEKVFVDYAGMTVPITNPETGELREAQVFVGVLGASNYSYTEVSESQQSENWLASQRRMLEFFGGVPEVIVPDNLKSGVKSPCRYEPELNPAYADFAVHYGLAVVPTRVRHPRDKAKCEVGVQIVEREILAPLRNRTFFSVREANQAVWELLDKLNTRPFQKLSGCRKSRFEELDKPCLRSLPRSAYEHASWKRAIVHLDYHVEVLSHRYSVPYRLVQERVDVRITAGTIEIFHQGKRVASHVRFTSTKGLCATVDEHMPEAHRRYKGWSPERFIRWASKCGEATAKLIEQLLASRKHPEQSYRSCLGVMRLAETYGQARLEAACRRALFIRSYSYKSVKSILQHGLDEQPLPEPVSSKATRADHANIRGASYYRSGEEGRTPSC